MATHPDQCRKLIFERGGYTYSCPINLSKEELKKWMEQHKQVRIRKPIRNRRLWWRQFNP